MDDNGQDLQDTASQATSGESRRTRVGFPQIKEEKKGKGKIIFILLAILALAAVGVWLVFGKGLKNESSDAEPIPSVFEVEESTPTPTPVEIERDEVSIQILNGSGIGGAAGDLQEEVEELGYSDIEVGNASSQDYETTEVIFSSGLAEGVKDEIIDKLKEIYKDVDSEIGDAGKYDIKIITGYPKNYTPSPTKAAATATPTPVAEGTLTPTVTPTP